MSPCDPRNGTPARFDASVAPQLFTPPLAFDAPWSGERVVNAPGEVVRAFDEHGARINGLNIETVAQGAGGMRFHHPAFLRGLRALCDQHGILLLLDEAADGGHRTAACPGAGVGARAFRRGEVRTPGAIGVIELRRPIDTRRVHGRAVASAVWLRPFGRMLYAMPSFTITPQELSRGSA